MSNLLLKSMYAAAMAVLIAIIFEQRRAATAERAVDPGFHCAQLQAIRKLRRRWWLCHQCSHVGFVGQHGIDAHRQLIHFKCLRRVQVSGFQEKREGKTRRKN